MLSEIVDVSRFLGVGQHHDNHVATFFQGHCFVISLRISQSLWKPAKVVDRIFVWIVATFLILEEGRESIFDEIGIEVQHDGPGREDDVHCLDVTVGADFL